MGKNKTLCALGSLVLAFTCSASIVDLSAAGSEGAIGGALFVQSDANPTGTGFIDSFVQISANTDITQAYNTTVNNVFDNGSSNNFNHEVLLTDIPIVNIDGTDYCEFLLDINQTGSDPLLSLDEIQMFTSDTPNQSVETFTAGILDLSDATLVYDLDGSEDSHVVLNYALNGGSGNGDMLFYVPSASLFATGQTYVYLYSLFGENHNANAGFEEWAFRSAVAAEIIPEPSSFALMAVGIAFAALRGRRLSSGK